MSCFLIAGFLAALAASPEDAGAGSECFAAAGSRFELTVDPALGPSEKAPWKDWIRTSARAVATVSGRFPEPEVAVSLEARESDGPVGFGRVRRGSPPRVHFYVRGDATLEELEADWHGYHEFAHLLLPFPGNADRWFSEGLASYFQYLLMARAGVIEPDEAWRKLAAGFWRGLDDPAGRGRSLRELGPDMRSERAFRRVYWTGAAYFLRVDLGLRIESRNRHSLDSAIAAFHECCMDARGSWSALALIRELGRLSVPRIWEAEYERMIDATAAPEFETAFGKLGIRMSSDGRVEFRADAEQAGLRARIAGPRGLVNRDSKSAACVEPGRRGLGSGINPGPWNVTRTTGQARPGG